MIKLPTNAFIETGKKSDFEPSRDIFVPINENAGAILGSIESVQIRLGDLTNKLFNPKLSEYQKILLRLEIAKLNAELRELKKKTFTIKLT